MKPLYFAFAALLFTSQACAKDELIRLDAANAAKLDGKSMAITLHERPGFAAMTAGKVTFGLLGAAAMVSAGNKIIDGNHVVDPALLVREQLAHGLQDAFGVVPLPPDTAPTKFTKPHELAALHQDADYVLDVRSAGWGFAYYPTKWATYWMSYAVQVQLVETATKRVVSNAACNINTNKHPHSPSQDALVADGAKLLKDVTAALGWACIQLLGKEQLQLPAEKIPATPADFVDPLTAYAKSSQQQPAAAVAEEVPASGAALTPDAAGAPASTVPTGNPEASVEPSETP